MSRSTHSWTISPQKALDLQSQLAQKIILENRFQSIRWIAGADVGFDQSRQIVFGSMVVLSYPDLKLMESIQVSQPVRFPYIPGLLSFREGPVLLKTYQKLRQKPDLIIFDGQGIAHPRGIGIASHLGLILDKPTIGCAKSWLFGRYKEPGLNRGDYSYLTDMNNKKIGVVLRSRDHVKPVFISPGHKINITSSIKIILNSTPRFRLPEPIRLAHHYAHDPSK